MLKSTGDELELYFLPGYALELNPDELLWSYGKRTGTAKRRLTQDSIGADLLLIQNNPALVGLLTGK